MRFLQVVAVLLPSTLAKMAFLNPPPGKVIGDYSKSPTYVMGSVMEVSWTSGSKGKQTSLTLWQINPATGLHFGSMEYIARKPLYDVWYRQTSNAGVYRQGCRRRLVVHLDCGNIEEPIRVEHIFPSHF